MTYSEFVKETLADADELFCPFDGVWCERCSCDNCPQMKAAYDEMEATVK